MKYLCLIYDEEKKLAGMTKSESDAFMGEYGAYSESVKASGHYLGGNPLQPVQTATTIRSRNGKVSTTDGPFAETKDLIAGWMVIDVDNDARAIELAAIDAPRQFQRKQQDRIAERIDGSLRANPIQNRSERGDIDRAGRALAIGLLVHFHIGHTRPMLVRWKTSR